MGILIGTKYGIVKRTKPVFPLREVLIVPHKNKDLIVGYPAFGPEIYGENLTKLSKAYSHPEIGDEIYFRPATTSESISIAAYEFGENGEFDSKRDIFDTKHLQAGYIVKTQDGIFTNTSERDESKLKLLLTADKKVNGIYLLDDEMAFAPYESFEESLQDIDTFVRGGLARALEHTSEKTASKLRGIGSPRFYKHGINVGGFKESGNNIVKVANFGLNCDRGFQLDISGRGGDKYSQGFTFGILKHPFYSGPRSYLKIIDTPLPD